MQGYQLYHNKLFSIVNLREMTPYNHLLVKVNDEMDFSFIYELSRESCIAKILVDLQLIQCSFLKCN